MSSDPNPDPRGRLVPAGAGYIWQCMGPTCFFTAPPSYIQAINAHLATCVPVPTTTAEPDYVLNAAHGACFTTGTGQERWRCAYCPSDRTLAYLQTIRTHLAKHHGVVTTVSKEARVKKGQLGPMKKLEELVGDEEDDEEDPLLFVLNPAYGTCHVTDCGEERWRCRYCSANLLAVCSDMHPAALKAIKRHLLDKHGLVSTTSLKTKKQEEMVRAVRQLRAGEGDE